VGIKKISMSLVCRRPCVVKASDRIIPSNIYPGQHARESILPAKAAGENE
jgi:hypothetical protein